ncbi:Wall-associated receptor kinase [Sesamum alatum]|uniref:Wall-associated receptor kinase n=1 Tax=Sesamum alatum TaxID=300844 RepID=A0AAE1XPD9_9LAMI|nr:Wall-associated receptor kinase [Sesamum alatum]
MSENMLLLLPWIFFCGLTLTFAAINTTTDTLNISKGPTIAKPGCPSKCGDLAVPYPFGIGRGTGCGIGEFFELDCNNAFDPPRASIANIQVYQISDNQMRISNIMARKCYNGSNEEIIQSKFISTDISVTPYSFSELNRFTVIGCNDFAEVTGGASGRNFSAGCFSACLKLEDVRGGYCSGTGCCETSLAKSTFFIGGLNAREPNTSVSSFNPCSYAFVGEQKLFVFNGASDLTDPNFMDRVMTTVPIVLDWAIGNLTCAEVRNSTDYACQANSNCVDSDRWLGGYRCSCNEGYEGNPYLDPGCTDIDECADPNKNDCEKICINTVGSYNCSCPEGENGIGRKDGRGCTAPKSRFPVIQVALGSG